MQTTVYDYRAVLISLQQVAPKAHIAGGAVRDTILDREIADIDVFIADEHVDEAASLLRSSFGYVKVGEWKQYLGFSDPAMTRVAKFEKADATIPICIIGLLPGFVDPKKNIERFDFGVCMAAYDGHDIIRAARFNIDVKDQTFTLCRADNMPQYVYSMSRFKKLTRNSYEGWGLVIPTRLQSLAKEHSFRKHWYSDFVKGLDLEDGGSVLKPKERV